ncbi:MAG: acyltransferase [Clostridia bacterium]|nr:acyltransferase [Clostridia bacterium]
MDKLVYLCYPLVLLLLFWGSKWHGKKQWNEEFFNLDQSKMLQGFLAICVMLHHCGQKTCAPWKESQYFVPGLDFFVPIGYFFVAVFFVCSGFGLYKSYHTKENYLKGFLWKRVLPLIIAFYVTEWIFLGIRLLDGEKMSNQQLIQFITGIKQANPNAWFVITMPLFYLFFYISYGLLKKDWLALPAIWLLVLGWVLLGCSTNHNEGFIVGEWWYNSALFFPLGLTFAKVKDKFIGWMKKHGWVYVLSMVVAVVAGYFLYRYSEFAQNHFSYYCEWVRDPSERLYRRFMTALSQFLAALPFVYFMVMMNLKVKLNNKALRFMGAVTLEFYLIHAIFVDLFGFHYREDVLPNICNIKNVLLYVYVVFATSLPATLLLRKILHPRQPMFPEIK